LEGLEESGGEGLEEYVVKESKPGGFLSSADFFCISDNYWLGKTKPCLTYGLRGLAYFSLEIECAKRDLHSGVYGGTVHEAMTDLVHMLSKLIDTKGKILVPGIYKDVDQLTSEEENLYKPIDFDVEEYKKDAGLNSLIGGRSKAKILQNRWRNPTCTIHGIEGAFSGPGQKTVIPGKVIGKFSFRLVPSMDPTKVDKLVTKYLNDEWKKLESPNHMKVTMMSGSKAWVSNPNHINYRAGKNATKKVWNLDPDFTREGGSIPITLTFEEKTGKNVLLLPMGSGDDGAHSQNEKINIINYIQGIKLLGTYLDEISQLS